MNEGWVVVNMMAEAVEAEVEVIHGELAPVREIEIVALVKC